MQEFDDYTGYPNLSKKGKRAQFKKLLRSYFDDKIQGHLERSQIFITKSEERNMLAFLGFMLSPEKWKNGKTNNQSRGMYRAFFKTLYSFTRGNLISLTMEPTY